MTAAGWFGLAAVALVLGLGLLALDARRRTARSRARREWAEDHGLRHTTADPVVTAQWSHGPFAHGGAGRALDLVSGRRRDTDVHVLDLEQRGTVTATLVALRRPTASETALELRPASSTLPREVGIDLLGPVGPRYAFTTDLESARRAVDQRMVALAEGVPDDVLVLWGEGGWALAAVAPSAGPAVWEQTLDTLQRFADLLRLLPPTAAR